MSCFAQCFGGKSPAIDRRDSKEVPDGNILARATDILKPFCRPGEVNDEYSVSRKVLGYGMWGSVKEAKSKADGQVVALKTISKEMLARRPARIPWLLEFECMAAACSGGLSVRGGSVGKAQQRTQDHITSLIAVYEDRKNLYMIMEMCSGGDLFQHIAETRRVRVLDESDIRTTATELLLAVEHLHRQGIIHRDIKPENLLHEGGHLKVCDFGSATTDAPPLRDFVSTAFYAAPEVFSRKYGPKADMWSVGIVLHVMLVGPPPVLTKATCMDDSEFAAIQHGKVPVPDNVSQELGSLIRKLLEPNPDKRLSAQQALRHPWVCGAACVDGPGAIGGSVHEGFMAYFQARKLQHAATTLLAVLLSPAASLELSSVLEKTAKGGAAGGGGRPTSMTFKTLTDLLMNLREDEEHVCAAMIEELVGQMGGQEGDAGMRSGVEDIPFDAEEFIDVVRRRCEIVKHEGEENLHDASQAVDSRMEGSSVRGVGSRRWYSMDVRPNEGPGGSVRGMNNLSMFGDGMVLQSTSDSLSAKI